MLRQSLQRAFDLSFATGLIELGVGLQSGDELDDLMEAGRVAELPRRLCDPAIHEPSDATEYRAVLESELLLLLEDLDKPVKHVAICVHWITQAFSRLPMCL